jgi:hypothetical protein
VPENEKYAKIPSLGVKCTQLSSSQKLEKNVIACVVDTTDKHSYANISADFWKKIVTIPIAYSGARGTLIYEKKPEVKNLVSDSL